MAGAQRYWTAVAFVAGALLLSSCSPQGQELISVAGTWQVAKGRVAFDEIVSSKAQGKEWSRVELPYNLRSKDQFADYKGWLTLRRPLPEKVERLRKQEKPLAINLGSFAEVIEVYINNYRLGAMGSSEPHESALYMRFRRDIPSHAIKPQQENRLIIYLYSQGNGYPLDIDGPTMSIGPAGQIYEEVFWSGLTLLLFSSIYFYIGLYHLLLFVRRKKEKHNLLFGLFSLVFGFLTLYYLPFRDEIFGYAVLFRLYSQHFFLYSTLPLLILFFEQLFHKRYSKVGLIWGAFYLLLWLVEVASPYWMQNMTLLIWYISALGAVGYGVYQVLREVVRQNVDAYYLLAGMVVLSAGAVNDILQGLELIKTVKIADYTFLIFVMGIAGILASRFTRLHNEVEELNVNLEKKVEQRTHELQETLGQVQALKVQQDGDYFLTSLLTDPLNTNEVNDSAVRVDFHIQSKKQFKFRKWEREIGGDMCMAHTIELRGKSYVFFINADAMGKSIQGAGGILVLGAVIKSMIQRTLTNSNEKQLFPEKWLRNNFKELQTIFESFNGSMLISVVMGLVDDSNGFMYFINAEHPWTILYRGGEALFIENELSFYKLGTQGMDNQLWIRTFQMIPGDVIVAGSDGRDDILLSMEKMEEEEVRVINEDENAILEHVRQGDGELEPIVSSIKAMGELTDDFSLLRIAYFPKSSAESENLVPEGEKKLARAQNLLQQNDLDNAAAVLENLIVEGECTLTCKRRDQLLVKIYLKMKAYAEAMRSAESYIRQNPEDSNYIYLAAYSAKWAKRYKNAIDFGERLRLRDPNNIKNLINLADAYRLDKNFERARKIYNEAEVLAPENAYLLRLKELLPQ